jgi:frataxin
VADETLDLLQDQLDELLEDASVEDSDVKCDSGVLELTLGDKGTYVINKQAPNKQIWLSSPLSGPFRYDYSKEDESWIYSRDKHKLEEKLSKELSEILNTTIMIKTSELL